MSLSTETAGTSLVGQRLRCHTTRAGGAGSIPGQETKIPKAVCMAQLKKQKQNKTRKNKTMHKRVWSEIKYCKTKKKKKSINLAFYIQQICFSKTKTGKKKKKKDRLSHTSKNWGNSLSIHTPCKKKKLKKVKKEILQAEGKTYIGQNLGST